MFGRTETLADGSSVWRRPSAVEQAEGMEALKAALRDAEARPISMLDIEMRKEGIGVNRQTAGAAEAIKAIETAMAEKSVSADVLASIAPQLERLKGVTADVAKDWLSNNPLSDGLVAYDLQEPSKKILPKTTPLSNRTPRTTQGVGTTARYKRIIGVTNLGVGGVADQTTFFNSESVGTTFGGVTGLRRPPKISYAADEKAILFQEQGLSDSVSMKAFYQSQGFENLRQLSQTALLWASKVGEEKSLLYSRGSASGFEGAVAAPTGVAFASNSTPPAGVTGNTANVANLYGYVQALAGRGQSVNSTVATTTTLSAVTGKTSVMTWTDALGAYGYAVYLGTTTGIANAWFAGTTATNSFTPSFTGGGTGGVPNSGAQPSASDTSADVNGYDGFLTVLADPTLGGYVGRLNAGFSSANPGAEYQTAFANLYSNGLGLGYTLLADPDVIWIYAGGRVALSDLLKTASSANYRLTIDQGESGSGVRLGSIVTGIVNETTGKMVDFEVHPYMPKGCSIIHSETLPVADTEISSTVEVRNVVDYTAIEWAPIQMSYDTSTYWLGAPIFYAPMYSGVLLGIGN